MNITDSGSLSGNKAGRKSQEKTGKVEK